MERAYLSVDFLFSEKSFRGNSSFEQKNVQKKYLATIVNYAEPFSRLGGGKKALPKWRQKKVKESPEEAKNRELMMQLTGFADAILTRSGNMEIYEETYEKIAFKIKQLEPKGKMTNNYRSKLYLSSSVFFATFLRFVP